ncbi:MAG: 3-methylornithine--L-lysine ligase PylC [Clostridiales bacterium]
MKNVVVVGGRLQGLEALYLGSKAGMHTTLIDKDEAPIGQNFCNRFIHHDVLQYDKVILGILKEADFVLPALENQEALAALAHLRDTEGINLIYDEYAYGISSSKLRSDEAMAKLKMPVPCHHPQGKLPYIAKPSSMSGSEGVRKLNTQGEIAEFLKTHDRNDWVIQEYLGGPSYSIEIIGIPNDYSVYHITELFMDKTYDCKRVMSCPDISQGLKIQFQNLALALGNMVQLHGIMDVEVIDDQGILKILEIDVRIPSQTPINIYHATGVNFMAELHRKFCPHSDYPIPEKLGKEKFVSLEQISVNNGEIVVLGEHLLAKAQDVSHKINFCGADEALTNYAKGKKEWVATMVCSAESAEALAAKRQEMFRRIGALQGTKMKVLDFVPAI